MEKRYLILFVILFYFAVSLSPAAWKYNGCGDINGKDDFKMVPLVAQSAGSGIIREPIEMAFDMDNEGNVDVYFIERHGKIKKYDAKTKKTTVLGTIKPETQNEDGLVGIVLDPKFKEKGWIYLFYSASDGFRLSRFTAKDGNWDGGSEKILLTIPSGRNRWHTGGALEFDSKGVLVISVGDNEAAEKGPANTNDLRGKILKIIPKDDGTYDIPKGNLWEFAAEKFEKDGKTDIAAQYRDKNLVRREIYAMGMRNPYAMGIDPKSDWVAYGDCGPDEGGGKSEEHSVVYEPGFYGWPYWTGSDYTQPISPKQYDEIGEAWWGKKDMNSPVNNLPANTGVKQLLPAIPAQHPYNRSCAMSGGIYRYDPLLDSKVKMPPHLDGAWFFGDFNTKEIWAAKLEASGKAISGQIESMWKSTTFGDYGKMLDLQVGPDGAFYVLGYTCNAWRQVTTCAGIYRFEYTGDKCVVSANKPTRTPYQISIDRNIIKVDGESNFRLEIVDIKGRVFFETESDKPASIETPKLSKSGLYIVKVHSMGGVYTKTFTVL